MDVSLIGSTDGSLSWSIHFVERGRTVVVVSSSGYHPYGPDRGLAAHLAHPDGTIIFDILLRSSLLRNLVVGAGIAA
jgi:hypothetical protein